MPYARFKIETVRTGRHAPKKFKICDDCKNEITRHRITFGTGDHRKYVCMNCVIFGYIKQRTTIPWWKFWAKPIS